jgi:hypothetical protein
MMTPGRMTAMYLLVSRLFLLFLLYADWAGDPYFGHSPLSRPLASQEAFCHSVANRTIIARTITLSQEDLPILQASIGTLAVDHSALHGALPPSDD